MYVLSLVLKRGTPNVEIAFVFARLTLSKNIQKKANTPASVNKCPPEMKLCQPPIEEG